MNRSALRALAFDIICIFVFVVIGTRNHKTDTGLSGVLFVAAPFLISIIGSRAFMRLQKRDVFSVENGVTVVLFTTAIGLILRRFVFDRGTATAFVIVATVFLFTTMLGWRAIAARRAAATAK
jgi:hypothetical protein